MFKAFVKIFLSFVRLFSRKPKVEVISMYEMKKCQPVRIIYLNKNWNKRRAEKFIAQYKRKTGLKRGQYRLRMY